MDDKEVKDRTRYFTERPRNIYASTLKNLPKERQTLRSGVIPLAYKKGWVYMGFALHAKGKSIGDFGGYVEDGETMLDAGLREFSEESLTIFDPLLNDGVSGESTIIASNLTATLFVPLERGSLLGDPVAARIVFQEARQWRLKAGYSSDCAAIIWLGEIQDPSMLFLPVKRLFQSREAKDALKKLTAYPESKASTLAAKHVSLDLKAFPPAEAFIADIISLLDSSLVKGEALTRIMVDYVANVSIEIKDFYKRVNVGRNINPIMLSEISQWYWNYYRKAIEMENLSPFLAEICYPPEQVLRMPITDTTLEGIYAKYREDVDYIHDKAVALLLSQLPPSEIESIVATANENLSKGCRISSR